MAAWSVNLCIGSLEKLSFLCYFAKMINIADKFLNRETPSISVPNSVLLQELTERIINTVQQIDRIENSTSQEPIESRIHFTEGDLPEEKGLPTPESRKTKLQQDLWQDKQQYLEVAGNIGVPKDKAESNLQEIEAQAIKQLHEGNPRTI